jgi:hypothetical protein
MIVRRVHRLDILRWREQLAPGHGVAGIGQQVAAVAGIHAAAPQAPGQRLDPRVAAQFVGRDHAPIGAMGDSAQRQGLSQGEFG